MFNKKKYILSFAGIPFKKSPLLATIYFLQRLIEAIIPTINVVVTANFVNTAVLIFNGRLAENAIYTPLIEMFALLVFRLLFSSIIGFITRKMQIKFNNQLELLCLEKQASLNYEYIDNSESYMLTQQVLGELPSRINRAFFDVLDIISVSIRFVSIILVFSTNKMWWIGLMLLLVSIPMIVVTYRNGKKIYKFYKENFPGQMEMYHSTYILKDKQLSDERTLFGFSSSINKMWKNMQLQLYEKKAGINKRIVACRYISRFFNLVCAFVIIIFMTIKVIKGEISVGIYTALVTAIISLIDQVITNVLSWANNISQGQEFLKDFNVISEYESDIDNLSLPSKEIKEISEIEFKNVTFSYPGTDRKVLNNVSFKICKGKHYGIVGKNGAGKSTIIKLITKLYNNYSGEIFINGTNIKQISYSDLKSMMGVIYQDFSKFEISFRENVMIGNINNIDQNDEKYHEILNDLSLVSLVNSLPKGDETFLGKSEENGQDVSGGEWQRIAIARLMMKPSNFVILDEPTSALDPVNESKLYEQFLEINKKRTTLLISHRLGALKTVEHIFVLDDGKIIEQGTHNELMSNDGLYRKLYLEQKGWYD